MTSIDDLAEEIMQGLQEYADLADTAMKKAVRKSATQVKNEISAKKQRYRVFKAPPQIRHITECVKGEALNTFFLSEGERQMSDEKNKKTSVEYNETKYDKGYKLK